MPRHVRTAWSIVEDIDLLDYLISQLKSKDPQRRKDAKAAFGLRVWQNYLKDNPDCGRSVQSINCRFHKQLWTRENFFRLPLSCDKMFYLIKELEEPVTSEVQKRLEKCYKCRLTLSASGKLISWERGPENLTNPEVETPTDSLFPKKIDPEKNSIKNWAIATRKIIVEDDSDVKTRNGEASLEASPQKGKRPLVEEVTPPKMPKHRKRNHYFDSEDEPALDEKKSSSIPKGKEQETRKTASSNGVVNINVVDEAVQNNNDVSRDSNSFDLSFEQENQFMKIASPENWTVKIPPGVRLMRLAKATAEMRSKVFTGADTNSLLPVTSAPSQETTSTLNNKTVGEKTQNQPSKSASLEKTISGRRKNLLPRNLNNQAEKDTAGHSRVEETVDKEKNEAWKASFSEDQRKDMIKQCLAHFTNMPRKAYEKFFATAAAKELVAYKQASNKKDYLHEMAKLSDALKRVGRLYDQDKPSASS